MKDKFRAEMNSVASNIRKIRESKNYTQDYLAVKLGISQNAYSKIELGYSKLALDRLLHICSILETEVMDLFSFKKEKNNH
jgi:transcriptional regulator with XRE-family HTH domain